MISHSSMPQGSPSFQGLGPNNTFLSQNWTLSMGVQFDNVTYASENMSIVNENVWLQTNANFNLSSTSLGFRGMIYVLEGFQNPSSLTGSTGDDMSCNGLLSTDCQMALVQAVQGQAAKLSGTNGTGSVEVAGPMWQAIMNTTSGACSSNPWGNMVPNLFLGTGGNIPFQSNDSTSCAADYNVGNGSFSQNAILGFSDELSLNATGLQNYTAYDTILRRPTAFLLGTWSNTNSLLFYDARLVCVMPNNTFPGSRVPPPTSAASKAVVAMGWTMVALVAVTLLQGLASWRVKGKRGRYISL